MFAPAAVTWITFRRLLALVALALVACTPAAAPPAVAPTAAKAPEQQAAKPAEKAAEKPAAKPAVPVVRGGKYVIGSHGDLISFDSVTEGAALHLNVSALVGSGLMKWGKGTVVDPTGTTCDLCESWKQLDATTWEFKLRQDVKWQNVPPVNGRELVADDVKYTYERIITGNFKNDPRFGRHQSKLATIASIETPDKYTLRIKLKSPDAAFLWNMGDPFFTIVAREQVEKEPDGILKTGLVGTGPFILKEFTPKVSYRMVRNPDYFLAGLPYLDEIEVRIIMDNTTRFNAFRAKEIQDPGYFMDADKKKTIDTNYPDLYLGEVTGMTTSGLFLNVNRPPLNDVRVRQALHLALDRQGIIDATRFGHAVLSRWLPESMGLYATPQEEVKKLPGYRQPKDQDVAAAKKLLAEAGYPNGFPVEIKVNKSANIPDDAEVVAEQWRKTLNLDVKLNILERAVHEKESIAGDFMMSAEYAFASTGDPTETLGQMLSASGANKGRYKNPKFDELFAKQQTTVDPKERKGVIDQMMKILDEDMPVIVTYVDYNYKGYPKKCHGVEEEPRYNVLLRYMAEAWCEEGVLKK